MAAVDMIIGSTYDDVPAVGEAVRACGTLSGLSDAEAGLYELAIVEAVNNAIEHAYGAHPGGRIEVRYTIDGAAVTAEVTNEGEPIGHGAETIHPALAYTAADRASLPEGGRGLAIIRNVFDVVAFEREGAVNRLRMTKHRRDTHA